MSLATSASGVAKPPVNSAPRAYTGMQAAVALVIAAFLLIFLVVPVATVIYVAFAEPGGGFTLSHFETFFPISLMRESFWNSLFVAAMSVAFATIIAAPLAYFTAGWFFRWRVKVSRGCRPMSR